MWNQCKQNQEVWFVAYLKYCFLYIIPANFLLWDNNLVCISNLAGENAEAICHLLLTVTLFLAQKGDMLYAADIK